MSDLIRVRTKEDNYFLNPDKKSQYAYGEIDGGLMRAIPSATRRSTLESIGGNADLQFKNGSYQLNPLQRLNFIMEGLNDKDIYKYRRAEERDALESTPTMVPTLNPETGKMESVQGESLFTRADDLLKEGYLKNVQLDKDGGISKSVDYRKLKKAVDAGTRNKSFYQETGIDPTSMPVHEQRSFLRDHRNKIAGEASLREQRSQDQYLYNLNQPGQAPGAPPLDSSRGSQRQSQRSSQKPVIEQKADIDNRIAQQKAISEARGKHVIRGLEVGITPGADGSIDMTALRNAERGVRREDALHDANTYEMTAAAGRARESHNMDMGVKSESIANSRLERDLALYDRNESARRYKINRADEQRYRNQDLDMRKLELEIERDMTEDARQTGMINNLLGGLFSLGSLL